MRHITVVKKLMQLRSDPIRLFRGPTADGRMKKLPASLVNLLRYRLEKP